MCLSKRSYLSLTPAVHLSPRTMQCMYFWFMYIYTYSASGLSLTLTQHELQNIKQLAPSYCCFAFCSIEEHVYIFIQVTVLQLNSLSTDSLVLIKVIILNKKKANPVKWLLFKIITWDIYYYFMHNTEEALK